MSYSKTIPLERPSHGESNELRAVRIRLWVLGIGPGQLSELTRELTSPPSSAGQLSCSADQLSAALRAIACIFFCRPPPMPRPLPLQKALERLFPRVYGSGRLRLRLQRATGVARLPSSQGSPAGQPCRADQLSPLGRAALSSAALLGPLSCPAEKRIFQLSCVGSTHVAHGSTRPHGHVHVTTAHAARAPGPPLPS